MPSNWAAKDNPALCLYEAVITKLCILALALILTLGLLSRRYEETN